MYCQKFFQSQSLYLLKKFKCIVVVAVLHIDRGTKMMDQAIFGCSCLWLCVLFSSLQHALELVIIILLVTVIEAVVAVQ